MGPALLIVLVIFFGLVLLLAFWAIALYNGLIGKRNRFRNAFAQIEVQLQRRYDLIPNLVETAKGYMSHEKDTLEAVIAARNQAMGAMQAAAALLVGRHDFTSFRASQCQADSPVRTLDELRIEPQGEELHIHAAARSFLHHQVRNIVGTLALVGAGKWTEDDVATALAAKDRSAAGPTAPPEGLYLTGVTYPTGI